LTSFKKLPQSAQRFGDFVASSASRALATTSCAGAFEFPQAPRAYPTLMTKNIPVKIVDTPTGA